MSTVILPPLGDEGRACSRNRNLPMRTLRRNSFEAMFLGACPAPTEPIRRVKGAVNMSLILPDWPRLKSHRRIGTQNWTTNRDQRESAICLHSMGQHIALKIGRCGLSANVHAFPCRPTWLLRSTSLSLLSDHRTLFSNNVVWWHGEDSFRQISTAHIPGGLASGEVAFSYGASKRTRTPFPYTLFFGVACRSRNTGEAHSVGHLISKSVANVRKGS